MAMTTTSFTISASRAQRLSRLTDTCQFDPIFREVMIYSFCANGRGMLDPFIEGLVHEQSITLN